MSPDQKGIETVKVMVIAPSPWFTMSPDQKGIETSASANIFTAAVHNEPRSKGD